MMTAKRLYYTDAYGTRFEARIIERGRQNGRYEVVLNQTLFYPTSGGQPHDTGTLNGVTVTDVFVRPEDQAVVHVTAAAVTGDEVSGEIDWPRRHDHMQQHTGQHILSQALLRVAGAETLSFHLGQRLSTIDVPFEPVADGALAEAERLANEIVWENRPVTPRFVSAEEARALPLRKLPELDGDDVRLVDIAGFDLTACGGTHVAATGGVGLLKILKSSRRGDEMRIEFVSGRRALDDYADRHRVLNALATSFTTDFYELPASVDALREELKQERRRGQKIGRELARYEAAEMLREGIAVDGARVVCRSFTDRDPAELRLLAAEIAGAPGGVALLGLSGPRAQLVFARSGGAPGDAARLLQAALPYLGEATGGGTAAMAQGGGPAAGIPAVDAALQAALARYQEERG